ncbi:MAG TPA: lactate racemase domain-containing protein [Thermoleophilia bacterium]|nr:lactate racemase domain-containing protein [Thermoleophilia bacterium]
MSDLVLMAGDDLVEVTIGGAVRVIDPPPPLEPLPDFAKSVRRALRAPMGLPQLRRLVGPGARVTVAFDDPCLPLPPPWVDPRRQVLEQVVDALSDAGVRDHDLTLVCANGLHRRWRARELAPIVGPRLRRRFGDRIVCYDAEDAEANVSLGPTESGLLVEVSRLVADADLVVYVGVPWTEMNGGHKSLACGLSTYACIAQHHRSAVQVSSPLMSPESSAMHGALRDIGRHIGARVPVFQVETLVNNRLWAGPFRSLDLRRRRLSAGMRQARRAPASLRRLARRNMRGSYQPAGIWAGAVEPVHTALLERMAANRVAVEGQSDILVLGVPNMSPYAVHADMNPLLTVNLGLGYSFQFGRGRPLVREGGIAVLVAPCSSGFDPVHHPSYERFWNEVLSETRDAAVMEREWEPGFAVDADLVAAYRQGWAYHPAHPFFAWYWMARALRHLDTVIVAGCEDPAVVEHMGFLPASNLERAVDMARGILGPDATVSVQSVPPVFTVDVSA